MDKLFFDDVFNLMKQSFPEAEFRTYDDQKNLLNNSFYSLKPYFNNKHQLLAFIASWEFSNFIFVEHIAVSPNARGMGLGTKIMNELINSQDKMIILEIEPPNDDICTRRMNFYKKLGFKINNFEYFQMPLRKNSQKIPLKIMSYPETLSQQKFESIQQTILKHVYQI